MRLRIAFLGAAGLMAACAHPRPPGTPLRASAIPSGCEMNLAGHYVHAESSRYHYEALDDGGTLTLQLKRQEPDGGVTNDSGNTRIQLTRSARGFVGQTLSTQPNGENMPCPVAFPTELLGCSPTGLLLRSLERTATNEACHAPQPAPPSPWVEQRLNRE